MEPILRKMSPADIPGGMRLSRASGWNQLEEDWRTIVECPGGGAWLLERDAVVIGTAAVMRYDRLAWIAMMLVDPAERRAGHGARLLAEAMAAARSAPCVGLDATPAGEPLYRKFGFAEDYSLVRMKAVGFTASASRARPMTAGDLEWVCQMDREVFGADRGALLASLLERAPECARVVEGSGYCFGRPGRLFHELGPVVAANVETARDLVASAAVHPMVVDVPRFHSSWIEWLKAGGFVEERPLLRMFLEGHHHPGTPSRQYTICGPEFA